MTTNLTRQEAAKLVAVAIAACPQQSTRLDEKRQLAMVDTFASLLGDLSYEQASRALAAVLQTSPYLPAVADIRAAAVELAQGPASGGVAAWGAVLDAIRRYGAYRTPGVDFAFADPLVAECVATMGWPQLCGSESPVPDRARFVELYDGLAKQGRREIQAPILAAARAERDAAQIAAGAAVRRLLPDPEAAS